MNNRLTQASIWAVQRHWMQQKKIVESLKQNGSADRSIINIVFPKCRIFMSAIENGEDKRKKSKLKIDNRLLRLKCSFVVFPSLVLCPYAVIEVHVFWRARLHTQLHIQRHASRTHTPIVRLYRAVARRLCVCFFFFWELRKCAPHQWPFRITNNSASFVRCTRRRRRSFDSQTTRSSMRAACECVWWCRMTAKLICLARDREHQRWMCHRIAALAQSRYSVPMLVRRSQGKQCVNSGRRSNSHSRGALRFIWSVCVSRLTSTQQSKI